MWSYSLASASENCWGANELRSGSKLSVPSLRYKRFFGKIPYILDCWGSNESLCRRLNVLLRRDVLLNQLIIHSIYLECWLLDDCLFLNSLIFNSLFNLLHGNVFFSYNYKISTNIFVLVDLRDVLRGVLNGVIISHTLLPGDVLNNLLSHVFGDFLLKWYILDSTFSFDRLLKIEEFIIYNLTP